MSLSSKNKMLLRFFEYAKTRKTKILMSENEYKKFFRACGYIVGINNEIKGNHADFTSDLICHDYKTACKKSYLSLDYNSIYGGYIIERFCNESGAINHDFISYRLTASKLDDALEFYLKGFYAAETKNKEKK